MKITTTHEPRDRESWRNWLEFNHAQETEIWVVFSKKDDRSMRFTYQDALLEALCLLVMALGFEPRTACLEGNFF